MAKPEWGSKRLCQGCGARFYDLQRNPITCPKCDAVFEPVVLPRSRRAAAKAAPKVVVPPPAEKPQDAEAALKDTGVDAEAESDDKDGSNPIEDPSELGEDDAEVADAVEGSREDKEDS